MTTNPFKKVLVAITIGLVCYVLFVVSLEVGFGFVNRAKASAESAQTVRTPGFYALDPVLGYRPQASSRHKEAKILNKEKLNEATYTIDQFQRRFTPVHKPEGRDKYLMFFNGSTIFGEGVNDIETVPTYAGIFASDYTPYNYAFSGYGPQHLLAHLEREDVRSEIKEASGILVYNFSDADPQRAIGTMQIYNSWGFLMPYYRVENGELVRRGNFTSGRPILSKLYPLLGKSQVVKRFNLNFPPKTTEAHIKLTATIIERARDLYREKFGNDAFYVTIYPKSKLGERIFPYFKKAGIKYFDYSETFDFEAMKLTLKADGHPKPQAHALFAMKLVSDLDIKNPIKTALDQPAA